MPELELVKHDDTLERIVLGAIVSHHKQAGEALDSLTEEDFFNIDHQQIFGVMQTLAARGEAVDLVTLYDEMGRMDDLQGEILFQSLGNLGQDAQKTQEIMYAVRELRRLSMAREALKLLESRYAPVTRSST